MTGPEGQLKAIKVSERSGTIIIGGRGIAIGGSNISIGGGGSTPNDVKIIVQVPKGAAVDLSDVDGRITVGDTEGSLRLSVSGEANVRVGRIGTLRARLSGSSQMDIRQVTGDVSINVSGAGSINIAGGEVKELTVSLSGMGNVHFGGTAQDAYLSVSGMGNVNVDRVVNQLHRSMSGMGRITVGNW